MSAIGMIEIPLDEYYEMVERLRWLDALEAVGVDNWGGYEYAMEIFRESE